MAACEAQDDTPPASLLESGWRKGTIFSLPGAEYVWIDDLASSEGQRPVLDQRRTKDKELLILVSQDCDIVSNEELRIEALVVKIKDKPQEAGYLDRIINSYREFVIDRSRGYVIDARYRIHIRKELLWQLQPTNWLMNDQVRDDFIDWLASRYARPPIPDEVHEAVCKPIRNELEQIRTANPSTFEALNRSIRMMRIRLPAKNSTPLEVGILCVISDDIDHASSLAIESTIADFRRIVEHGHIACVLHVEIVSYEDLLFSEYQRTRLLDLNYMTKQGREISLTSIGRP